MAAANPWSSYVTQAPSYAKGAFDSSRGGIPGTSHSKVELNISCRKLADMDFISKSDPQVFVFQLDLQTSKWVEVGRTEMIKNNLNPHFATNIKLDYHFEQLQSLRFVVVDIDKEGGKLEDQDLIGTLETSLAEIVGSSAGSITRKLVSPKGSDKNVGMITIASEEVKEMRVFARFSLEGVKLDKKDLFGKSDPFLRIMKHRQDGSWVVVHKTEVVRNTLNPVWNVFKIPLHTLCGGDYNRRLKIECLDWNRSGKEEFMGGFETTLNQMLQTGQNKGSIDLIDEARKRKKRHYKNSGYIRFVQCEIATEPSFLDFIRGGCEINLIVAVDYTASNGDPSYPTSLHYKNPFKPNEYIRAIRAVGDILANYDSDQLFPCYGFGAKIPPHMRVSHCFPLNFNENKPEVHGVQGILDAYQNALENVKLQGPTNFRDIIQKAASFAPHCNQQDQKYVICLIITDGEITDMMETIGAIVNASVLPLSIVIVGVGSANFQKMDVLDADDNPLKYQGRTMARDIVQFVPFRDFENQHPSKLAAHVLEEIPEQLLTYMKSRGIKPKTPIQVANQSYRSMGAPMGAPDPSGQMYPPAQAPLPGAAPIYSSGGARAGMMQPGMTQQNMMQPGMMQPGQQQMMYSMMPGMMQPGMGQPVIVQGPNGPMMVVMPGMMQQGQPGDPNSQQMYPQMYAMPQQQFYSGNVQTSMMMPSQNTPQQQGAQGMQQNNTQQQQGGQNGQSNPQQPTGNQATTPQNTAGNAQNTAGNAQNTAGNAQNTAGNAQDQRNQPSIQGQQGDQQQQSAQTNAGQQGQQVQGQMMYPQQMMMYPQMMQQGGQNMQNMQNMQGQQGQMMYPQMMYPQMMQQGGQNVQQQPAMQMMQGQPQMQQMMYAQQQQQQQQPTQGTSEPSLQQQQQSQSGSQQAAPQPIAQDQSPAPTSAGSTGSA